MTGPSLRKQNSTVTVLQASMASPTLARLTELGRDSNERLRSILPLLPIALRSAVKSGPIEGATWCLLLDNSATAAKLRQIAPTLEAHLRSKGWAVESIRLKVQKPAAQ